jgi:hypothetical protein
MKNDVRQFVVTIREPDDADTVLHSVLFTQATGH